MPATPGRNDPCPCGSGRKYKHCCLRAHDEADAARVRVRMAEGRVVPAVFKFALDTWGRPLFEHAWDDFWLYEDVPEDIAAQPEFEGMFMAWFTLAFVPDPQNEAREDHWPTEPPGLRWLESLGAAASPSDRAFVLQAVRSPFAVFAVDDVEPGRSVDVHDVITGTAFHVRELTASRTLRRGDLVFTRVVTLEGVSLFFGMAPYVAPPSWHTHLLDWRDTWKKKRPPTREVVDEFDMEIRDLYFTVREEQRNPRPPQVNNADGDPLMQVTLTYALDVPVAMAYDALLPLCTLGPEAHTENERRDRAGVMTSADMLWVNRTGRRTATTPVRHLLLGFMKLGDGRLVVNVNSEKRAAAIARQIEKRLPGRVRLAQRQVDDPVAHAHARAVARKGLHAVPEPRPVEIAAVEGELRRRLSREWLDTPVPALKGKTPRQAARTAAGRERLEAVLLGFGRGGDGVSDDEVAFLRAELKLPTR